MLIDGVNVIIVVYNHGSTSDGVRAGFVPSKLQGRVIFDREISGTLDQKNDNTHLHCWS